jgi:hypothetical protein
MQTTEITVYVVVNGWRDAPSDVVGAAGSLEQAKSIAEEKTDEALKSPSWSEWTQDRITWSRSLGDGGWIASAWQEIVAVPLKLTTTITGTGLSADGQRYEARVTTQADLSPIAELARHYSGLR